MVGLIFNLVVHDLLLLSWFPMDKDILYTKVNLSIRAILGAYLGKGTYWQFFTSSNMTLNVVHVFTNLIAEKLPFQMLQNILKYT